MGGRLVATLLLVALNVLTGLNVSWAVPPTAPDGVKVTGRLTATKDCTAPGIVSRRENPQVWVSVGQILLYQLDVPVGGTYEFHLKPGAYELLASNPRGCLAQSTLTVQAGTELVSHLELATPPRSAPLKEGKAPAGAKK